MQSLPETVAEQELVQAVVIASLGVPCRCGIIASRDAKLILDTYGAYVSKEHEQAQIAKLNQ